MAETLPLFLTLLRWLPEGAGVLGLFSGLKAS
jgi:hypothetical protein